jgi:hypothetical protein
MTPSRETAALHDFSPASVRFGFKLGHSAMAASGLKSNVVAGPRCVRTGVNNRSKTCAYSITSSAHYLWLAQIMRKTKAWLKNSALRANSNKISKNVRSA